MSQKEAPTPQQKVIIKYEVKGQPLEIKLNEISYFFSDLDKYNSQFSLGAAMARMFIGQFSGHFKDSQKSEQRHPDELLRDESESQEITAFFLGAQYKDILKKIGLSLEPVSSGTTIAIEGAAVSQKQLSLNLKSKDHFINFLAALDVEQVNSTTIRNDLARIPDIFARQILKSYDLLSPEQEAIELFSGMKKIIEEYQRLGMTEAVEKLSNYYDHGMKGDLREYVAIERKGLLSNPGEYFGPADWQIDSTSSMLQSRWDEAVALLEETKQNPKAEELYEQLADHLQMCIKVAIKSLDGEISHYDPKAIKKFRLILEAKQQKIKTIREKS